MSAASVPAIVAPRAYVGIHDGHNAAVAIVQDGKLRYALQEERLTRVKNQGDAPKFALRGALELFGDEPPARIALNGRYMNYHQWQRDTVIRDYERSATVASRLKQPLKNTFIDTAYQNQKAVARRELLHQAGIAGVMTEVEHHRAHASAAYYTAPWREVDTSFPDKTLVLTCDGSGDRLCATVNIGAGASLTRLAAVSEHDSIGRLYSLITRYLGMVPLEHEYKVMGLAPYSSAARESVQVARILQDLFEFPNSSLTWHRKPGVPSMYSAYGFLERILAGQRFDYIAAGVQIFMEQMLTTWVRNAIRETGVHRIACSGGVFMNVKANLSILELNEVEEMYVFPSCGDESNSIGAACWESALAGEPIAPLRGIYFGESITDEHAESVLEEAVRGGAKLRFWWEQNIERRTATELSRGHIVARANGPVEFGARSLGNRSILAPADDLRVVRIINEAIKNRDFWMPFAPSVLAERASDYYAKPKPLNSPYMMYAFRAHPKKASLFAAAQHPHDRTTRAHEVCSDHNPAYHRLLREYEAITGEGIVLNTSFNLHGEPIVYSAHDAVDVLLRSGLTRLALGNWWVEKIA